MTVIGLHDLRPAKGSKRAKKRVGRGLGSTGTYSGHGVKGQKARSGVSGLRRLGAKRLILATPKRRGFRSAQKKPDIINLDLLNQHLQDGDVVTLKLLKEYNLVPATARQVKILGQGQVARAFKVEGCLISASARKKITEAGGSVL